MGRPSLAIDAGALSRDRRQSPTDQRAVDIPNWLRRSLAMLAPLCVHFCATDRLPSSQPQSAISANPVTQDRDRWFGVNDVRLHSQYLPDDPKSSPDFPMGVQLRPGYLRDRGLLLWVYVCLRSAHVARQKGFRTVLDLPRVLNENLRQ